MIDDVRDEIYNSDLDPDTKDKIDKELTDLENKVDEMIKNDATDSEISAEIQGTKDKIDQIIQDAQNQYGDQFKPEQEPEYDDWYDETQEAIKDANQAVQDGNEAIQKENNGETTDSSEEFEDAKNDLGSAFDKLEDQLKNEGNEWLKGEALKEQLGNMAQDFRDTANSMPEGDAKDIWNDLADAFEQAKDQAANGQDEEAIDTATGALDKAEGKFNEAFDKLEDMKDTQDNVSDRFEEGQSSIMGYPTQKPSDKNESSNDKNQETEGEGSNKDENNNENEEPSDGEGNENKPNPEKPSGNGNGSSEQDKNSDKIFVPGLGEITIEDLYNAGVLNGQYDKQFQRELTDEEREAIENYFSSIRDNNRK